MGRFLVYGQSVLMQVTERDNLCKSLNATGTVPTDSTNHQISLHSETSSSGRAQNYFNSSMKANSKFSTKHNGRQLGSKVFICNKLDASKTST